MYYTNSYLQRDHGLYINHTRIKLQEKKYMKQSFQGPEVGKRLMWQQGLRDSAPKRTDSYQMSTQKADQHHPKSRKCKGSPRGGLNEQCPHRLQVFEHFLAPVGGATLGGFRRCRLAGGSTSLGQAWEHRASHFQYLSVSVSFSSLSLSVSLCGSLALALTLFLPLCFLWVLEELSTRHSALTASCHASHMRDSNSSATVSSINSSFYKFPWSWCFVTATEN